MDEQKVPFRLCTISVFLTKYHIQTYLLIEEIQSHSHLKRQTPKLVEERTEVYCPVRVSCHEVDDLPRAELRQIHRAD